MSEHRRKPPQPQGGGRAAARRGQADPSSGRRAAPRGATGSPSDAYGYGGGGGEERPYGGRAEARRTAQRAGGGGRRRAAPDGAARGSVGGRGGGPGGPGGPPGRGRGRAVPSKKRFIDYPRAGQYGVARWVPSWRLATGLFIGFFGSMMMLAGIGYAMVGVPNLAETATAQNNVYYWSDGKEMVATGGETNRQIVGYEQIPEAMRNAVISAENKTFWEDKGVDPMGIARALFNMARGGETQGGSTITQQFVKNAMLDDRSQTVTRKFKELFVSIKVGAQKPKEEIMAGYLNSAYYGRGAYGIQAAARVYFDEDAKNLNPSQCAFLAAVLKGATYYDPAGATAIDPAATPEANKERAEKRWSWILDEEVKDGHLTATQRETYKEFPTLQNPRANAQLGGQIGYLVDLAKAYVLRNTDITENKLQQGGYQIYTTFDRKKVKELEDAVKKVRKENIKPSLRPEDTHVQFGGSSVNAETGAIEAIYGGEDATRHFTNNADVTGAQVGSTFKPFVLAAAMTYGVRDPEGLPSQEQDERTIVSPKSLYSGKNKLKIKEYDGSIWHNEKGKEWLQANDGDQSYNPPTYMIDLREAMRESVNSAYVQLGMDVGLDKVKQAAMDAGIKEDSFASANYPSFSLGTSDPSAIRMAGAYATFAASGKQHEPYSVKKVTDKDGTVFSHQEVAKNNQAFSADVADNVTDVLKTVVERGTGTAAQLSDRDVAGKTGTTDGNKSAWFVGYTKQLSTAITMFRFDDDEKNKKREFLEMYGTGGHDTIHGASFPAEIWHDYMEKAVEGTTPQDFPTPEPIGKVVGSMPSPSASPSATDPSASATPSASASVPSAKPSKANGNDKTCSPWDLTCTDSGGTTDGGTDSGTTDGGTGSTSPTPSASDGSSGGNGNGNGNGGIFGGPAG